MPRRIERFGEMVGEALAGYTFREAARLTGVSYTALANWASGEIPTSPEFVRAVADGLRYSRERLLDAAEFKVTDEDLAYDRDHYPVAADPILARFAVLGKVEWDRVPTVGTIHAETTEDGGDRTPEYPEGIVRLIVIGDCMTPTVVPGDSVRVRVTQEAKSGEIVVVSFGEEMVLRRYIQENGRVILRAENPAHSDITFPTETDGYRIEGVVLEIGKGPDAWERQLREARGE